MNPPERNQIVLVLIFENLFLIISCATVGCARLLKKFKTELVIWTQTDYNLLTLGKMQWVTNNWCCFNCPARIPQVSTLLDVLLWATFKNFAIVLSGMWIVLRPPSTRDKDGFVLRSNDGRAGLGASGKSRPPPCPDKFDFCGSVGKSFGYTTCSSSTRSGALGIIPAIGCGIERALFLAFCSSWNNKKT